MIPCSVASWLLLLFLLLVLVLALVPVLLLLLVLVPLVAVLVLVFLLVPLPGAPFSSQPFASGAIPCSVASCLQANIPRSTFEGAA